MLSLPDPAELEASLWRDLLNRWFPACIDPNGGYRQNFDASFRPTGDATKSLVFQSRMVWVCATVAAIRPEFADYARHGVGFLKNRLRDRRTGAFRWSTQRDEERHAYGLSFAVYGLAAAGRHLGDEEALEMAKDACTYLEAYHYDDAHGGYFEATDASGKPVLDGPEKGDAIGTPYGQKSQNTHLHLIEAYTELYRAWPDPLVAGRLAELVDVLANRLFTEPGHLTLFAESGWTPASTDTSYGHDIEAAHLLLDAADALSSASGNGRLGDENLALRRARALADNTLARGWDDKEGGIFYWGDDVGPTDRTKNWWAQAEALLGFTSLWTRTGDERYGRAAAEEWAFIRDHQIDHVHGGWYEEAGRLEMPKGHAWKAAYHDGRALLFTARLLREAL